MTDVDITSQADEHLKAMDTQERERMLKKLAEAREWTEHRLEPLSNFHYYSLRAGDYRAIVTWDRENGRIVVEAVGHRRNAYDRHLPPQPPRQSWTEATTMSTGA